LKERLRRKNPALILQPSKNNPKKTVDFHEILKRLQQHAGVTLDAADKTMLETVRDLRNPIEHGDVTLSLDDAERMIAALTAFAYLFARDELSLELESVLDSDVFFRVSHLRQVADRLNEEYASYLADWWKGVAAKYSRMSRKKVLALRDEVEPYHPKHNPDAEEIYICPICCEESVVEVEEGAARFCTNPDCRELYSAKRCERCGEPTFDDETTLCAACCDHLFHRDD
jgi:hypothetical protein